MLILLLLYNHVMVVVWDVIIWVTGWRVYESSLYYFSNFSISLKLLQLKPKQVAFIIYEILKYLLKNFIQMKSNLRILISSSFLQCKSFNLFKFSSLSTYNSSLFFWSAFTSELFIYLKLWWSDILIDTGQSMPY